MSRKFGILMKRQMIWKESLRDLWNNIKRYNLLLIRIRKEGRENKAKQ